MESYIDIATRQGLSGIEALEFASKQYEKDQEREERRQVREKEREEKEREREEKEKEREEKEKEREEKEKEREEREKESQFELEKIRLNDTSEINNNLRAVRKLPKLPPFDEK